MSFVARNHRQQVMTRGALDEVDDRGTPPELFNELSDQYGPFDLDVAAAEHNAKCDRYYTRSNDGLQQPWDGAVWCNPPYSDLTPWMRKAWAEWRSDRPSRIVMLVPANRTEQAWWQDYVEPYRDGPVYSFRTRFIKGRTRFIKPGQTEINANERPPFGCALLIWGRVVCGLRDITRPSMPVCTKPPHPINERHEWPSTWPATEDYEVPHEPG